MRSVPTLFHFTEKKTETQRISKSLNVTQLVSGMALYLGSLTPELARMALATESNKGTIWKKKNQGMRK